jgi:hypothetical protein
MTTQVGDVALTKAIYLSLAPTFFSHHAGQEGIEKLFGNHVCLVCIAMLTPMDLVINSYIFLFFITMQ